MRVSIEISKEECKELREFFKNYGTVQPLLSETGMHRVTLTNLLKKGKATKEIVDKVRLYVKKQTIEINEKN
jgi:hypothetical protein